MLAVVSPAKTLDTESRLPDIEPTQPRFLAETEKLAKAAAKLKAADLRRLMDISPKLAALNVDRFRAFETPFTPDNARPAIYTFAGDVYTGFDVKTLDRAGLDFAQDHLRILSGLYGLLRPYDLMQPYRLEMGVKLKVGRKSDLYGFWGDRIAAALAEELDGAKEPVLVNLASKEYFGAVPLKTLKARVIAPNFKELKDGIPTFVTFPAKKMRGAMARFLCESRIDRAEGMKDFAVDDYRFEPKLSDDDEWLFLKR